MVSDTNQHLGGDVRVRPSLGVALGIVVVYMAILLGLQFASGVDFDDVAASTSNVVGIVVVPVGVGSVLLFLTWRYLGWGRPVIVEQGARDRLGAWAYIPPLLVVTGAVLGFTQVTWGDLDMSFLLAVVAGTLFVGFSEELLTRGLLLHAARHRFSSEFQVALLTGVVFGLIHGVNIVTGQALGPTLQQVFGAFMTGTALYFVRRVTGTLVAAMLLHALFDAALFLQGEVRSPADDVDLSTLIGGINQTLLYISLVVALVMLWRRSRRP